MRYGRIFFVAVILICIFDTARLWGVAPAQMAAHFNLQGDPDRFVGKLEFFSFELQTLLTVILVSLPLQALFLVLPPRWINMPHRDYWLAPERASETINRLSSFGAILFGIILLAIQIVFDFAVSANLHTPIHYNAMGMFAVMLVALIACGALQVWLMLSFRLPATATSQ